MDSTGIMPLVSEQGELLPNVIKFEDINKLYPMPIQDKESGNEWDKREKERELVAEKLHSIFKAYESTWGDDMFEDGFPYNIKLYYADGNKIGYHFLSGDWETNDCVLEIDRVKGENEASHRQKMINYLITEGIITKL